MASPESNICLVHTNTLSILCLQSDILTIFNQLLSAFLKFIMQRAFKAGMELHCVGECPERQTVETFLKFYFIQLVGLNGALTKNITN